MKTKQWLIFPTIVVIVIIVVSYVAYNQLLTNTTLSKTEIESRIAALYGGKVETIQKNGSQYVITFAVDDYIYEVVANEDYGTFQKLVVIKEGKAPVNQNETPSENKNQTPNEQTEEPSTPSETPKPTPDQQEPTTKPTPAPVKPPAAQERLTEQQVIAIAKKEVAGTVDDVEFYPNNNGGYFIVEIENDTEDADDVTLQIHAITGKILSVSFED